MELKMNFSLKALNTFGIDVYAKYFSAFRTTDELSTCLEGHDRLASDLHQPPLILGGGSNILFTENYDGTVLKNEIGGIEKIKEDEQFVYLRAGGGVNWHSFVMYCVQNNFGGAENLSLIPGSVGASPMQNIGAYGVEIKDIFYELEAYSIADKAIVTFNNADCAFAYRESIFKHYLKGKFVIVSVTFRLDKVPKFNTSYGALQAELDKEPVHELSIKAISDAVIRIRQSKLPDPRVIGNAGSFFKNPTISTERFAALKKEFPLIIGYAVNEAETKLAAGWLIEQCGWKGFRRGDAGCHEKQALVLVNFGRATGTDILVLSEKIIDTVKLTFDVDLQREVNIV